VDELRVGLGRVARGIGEELRKLGSGQKNSICPGRRESTDPSFCEGGRIKKGRVRVETAWGTVV